MNRVFDAGFQLHNGAVVIASHRNAENGRVFVLAKTEGHHPYVTWQTDSQGYSCFWGHYFEDMMEACQDFKDRCNGWR